jgi:arsenate reductase
MKKLRLLFISAGNSCRNQMAEGWTRHLLGDRFTVSSAGFVRLGVNPSAIRVMAEAGVDISQQQSNLMDEVPIQEYDLIVTLCGHHDEKCHLATGHSARLHFGFDDPEKLAADAGTEEEALQHYRRVRDEIHDFIADLPAFFGLGRNSTPYRADHE